MRIEDYAMIGNNRTAALVGRDGSIDWLCAPRFDAPACFAALLGTADHGRWLLAPRGAVRRVERRYRDRTLVLETDFHTVSGAVRIVDCMPPWDERTDVVRIVEGLRGRVSMQMQLVIRGGYGAIVPWVRRVDGALLATAYPWSPSVGETFGLIAFVVVALGGFGSVLGSLYAGLIIGLIQAISAFWLGAIYKDIVVYGLFVVLLWFRPQGLMGKV
jgi:hypothetical protein